MNKRDLILKHFQFKHLLSPKNKDYEKYISGLFLWLSQTDHTGYDISSQILSLKKEQKACLIAHKPCIIAGLEEISFLLTKYSSLKMVNQKRDGDKVKNQEIVAKLQGNVNTILSLERTMLNILQRLSGIATQTRKLIDIAKKINPDIEITSTRKTPWMVLDKKAVAAGHGLTHRLDLSQSILLKDNHIQSYINEQNLKNRTASIQKILSLLWNNDKNKFIEIEVENKNEALAVLDIKNQYNPDAPLAILLDNFKALDAKQTIHFAKKSYNTQSVLFECSGSINIKNIKDYADSGADILSLGSLTHSAEAVDISLEISK